jgi:hypothetical protein
MEYQLLASVSVAAVKAGYVLVGAAGFEFVALAAVVVVVVVVVAVALEISLVLVVVAVALEISLVLVVHLQMIAQMIRL